MLELETNVTSDYVYQNDISVCGKLIFKRPVKNGNMFAISVGRRLKEPRINELTGKTERMQYRSIDVYFEGAVGKLYDKMFEVGDFVNVEGVVQKTRNNYLARNMVKIIGLNMTPKVVGTYANRDKNYVSVRGKVDHANALNENYIICDLYTNVHKRFRNPNKENAEFQHFEDDFVSITPIGINRSNGDAKMAACELTKGTWLDISGYIDVRKIKLRDDSIVTETRIVARDVYLIGQSQKAMP